MTCKKDNTFYSVTAAGWNIKKLTKVLKERTGDGATLKDVLMHGHEGSAFPTYAMLKAWVRSGNYPDLVDVFRMDDLAKGRRLMDEIVPLADGITGPSEVPKVKVQIDARKFVAARLNPQECDTTTRLEIGPTVALSAILEEAKQRLADFRGAQGPVTIEGEVLPPEPERESWDLD